MKKIVFYCTLILGGIIGLCNMITGIMDSNNETIYTIFFFVFIIFIIWGIAGSIIEIKKMDK